MPFYFKSQPFKTCLVIFPVTEARKKSFFKLYTNIAADKISNPTDTQR